MRAPHLFLHGNLVFATGPDDVWAAYRLDGHSYPGLSAQRKIELKERLEAFAYAVEGDFRIVRVAREWSAVDYVERALTTRDPRRGHPDAFARHLEAHRARLREHRVLRPEVFLYVRLGPPTGAEGVPLAIGSLRQLASDLRAAVGLRHAHAISTRRLARLRSAEERLFDRVSDYLPCERARSGETAYLIRAAYTRGLGEPRVDPNWRAQALWIEPDPNSNEPAVFEPYGHDLHRLHDSRLTIEPRHLRIDSELGQAHQALLVVGALPDQAHFPGADAELLFAPLEGAGFPVDAIYSATYVPNRAAQRLARRRLVDADQQAKEEAFGELGPSVPTDERTFAARELQGRLSGSDRPPFLRSAITLVVGAPTAEQLDERIERLRAEFGRVELHRPLGDQHRLFLASLPAQRFPLPEYESHWLPEQLGACVPTAVPHAGSEIGPYIGHTLTGSRAPIQFDLAEACRQNRPPTVYATGSLGAGKTLLLELLLYQAFLQGSTPIVDIDPKGDHRLDRLPSVAEHLETIELGPGEGHRGWLDPMRIAHPEAREDLAYGFLTSILPAPVPPEWQTEIRAAVALVAKRHDSSGAPTTGAVVDELARGTPAAREAARALEVHLDAGLARLGHGTPDREVPQVGASQIVSLRIRNLALPAPGTARADFQEDERVSQAVLRLLAAYAMRLCAADPKVHSCLALDEAWGLLADSQGQALLSRLARMGRSMNVSLLLASQIVGDAEVLEPLVGTYFAFGVETDAEVDRTLALLRLDTDDEALRQRLIAFRAGRCWFRDVEGRGVPMRIDPGPELLRALDTTPRSHASDVADLPDAGDPSPSREPDAAFV